MKKFYLGMDIGTESVGMACTDEQYNLLRAKGTDLWSVRLFDEAKDASERRVKRTARRRLQRRKVRIEFLQGVFAPYMEDEKFFLRLNNSGFYQEDKDCKLKTKFSLFADNDYTDVDFYKEYPTIFHLRQSLIEKESNKKIDLRHYYLAIHHIVKYRGHFLFDGENVSEVNDLSKLFGDFNEILPELNFYLPKEKAVGFKSLAMERKGLNDKKKEACALLGAVDSMKEIVTLLLGGSASAKKIFGDEFEEKYKDFKSLTFKGLTDENFEAMREDYEEDHYELLEKARAIYNFIAFEKVLDGNSTISKAMVALYAKHKEDLITLKKFIKNNYPKGVYYKIFRSTKENANYVNYVGYSKIKGEKRYVDKKCSSVDFYKFIKKTLESYKPNDIETLNRILAEIDDGKFLPKIINADNGLFPHQINGAELDLILSNLCKDYPEFAVKCEGGYSAMEKIKSIFLFKIPYYVGPLNCHGKNAWFVRNEGKTDRITPWNFNDVVDKAKSNEKFMRRMTNKCTYLHNKDVLPKGSMYYQAFDVLNQINKLTIDSALISVQLKQELFSNVFLKYKKVGVKQIKEYLVESGKCTLSEAKSISIGGFDVQNGIKANMSSYVIFKQKFGAFVDENAKIFEDIILWHTLNTDKSLVEHLVLKNYGDIAVIRENIKWIKGLTAFKEFGRLSKELLCEVSGGVDVATGEVYTILNRLYHTNDNFNQLIFSEEYSFKKAIEEENLGTNEAITYEDVAELYVSPMVRRGIWQALTMADEYVNAVGKAPEKIFIEVTRQEGKKGDEGRTKSRKNKILDLYKGVGADCADINQLLKELNREETTDSNLRQERLYLYYMQLGHCAYTGNPINLGELASDLYDVDHIIPRSIAKDDSLENKVLVERKKNAEKSDTYPLPQGFTNQQGFWKMLKSKNLMSQVKYDRLTRTKPLGEDDFRDFINRQLVVTNQTAKAVAELLQRKYQRYGTKIVYSKAKNVDDFKQRFEIVKCRETNDLHHARDAYLNVVVGNVYDTKFTCAHDYYYRNQENSWREYNLKYLYDKEIDGAWSGTCDIARVKTIASKTSMKVTRYAYTNHGAFYDETVYGKEEKAIVAPRKNCFPYNQIEKYGGFKSLKTAYFTVVKSKDKKGNSIKTIEAIPVLVDYQTKQNQNAIKEYLLSIGLVEPQIIVPKLKVKSLVAINGYKVWVAGITGKQIIIHNAQQWFTDNKTDLYVKQLVKLIEKDKNGKLSENEKLKEEIPLISNRNGIVYSATKEQNKRLYDQIISRLDNKIYKGLSSVQSFALKLQEKQVIFNELTTFNQCKVLLQIVRFMKCNAEKADLTLLEDGANCGSLLISKNITEVDFALIHQSACGLYERIQKI